VKKVGADPNKETIGKATRNELMARRKAVNIFFIFEI
jgi:hypothetical protein